MALSMNKDIVPARDFWGMWKIAKAPAPANRAKAVKRGMGK
jgi:hypothetical protein